MRFGFRRNKWTFRVVVLIATSLILVLRLHMKDMKTRRQQRNRPLTQETGDGGDTPVEKVKVIAMAYHRGGTPYLGKLFQKYFNSFYWEEPLKANLVKHRKELTNLADVFTTDDTYMTDHYGRVAPFSKDYVKDQTNVITKILNCDLDQLDKEILGPGIISFANKMGGFVAYRKCVLSIGKHVDEMEVLPEEAYAVCLPLITKACRAASLRVILSTRTAPYMIPKILENDPDVRLIHCTRDARGLFHAMTSRSAQAFDESWEQNWSKRTCFRMKATTEIFDNETNKTNAMTIRLEDIAADYKGSIVRLARFMTPGIHMSKILSLDWEKLDMEARDPEKEGKEIPNVSQWRELLPKPKQSLVTGSCTSALEQYGYKL